MTRAKLASGWRLAGRADRNCLALCSTWTAARGWAMRTWGCWARVRWAGAEAAAGDGAGAAAPPPLPRRPSTPLACVAGRSRDCCAGCDPEEGGCAGRGTRSAEVRATGRPATHVRRNWIQGGPDDLHVRGSARTLPRNDCTNDGGSRVDVVVSDAQHVLHGAATDHEAHPLWRVDPYVARDGDAERGHRRAGVDSTGQRPRLADHLDAVRDRVGGRTGAAAIAAAIAAAALHGVAMAAVSCAEKWASLWF